MNEFDFPLRVPAVNGLSQAIPATARATHVLVAYAGIWLRNHGIATIQAAQKVTSDRITTTIQNGLKYAVTEPITGCNR